MTPRTMLIVCGLAVLCAAQDAAAITWARTTVADPIQPGETCHVQEPMSRGSYSYDEPSKYDQVWWPFTDRAGIWFCPASGFTAFVDDFDGLTDAERVRIAADLDAHYQPTGEPVGLVGQLRLLEECYGVRDNALAFRNRLWRILAVWYDKAGDLPTAMDYRRRALLDIREKLTGTLGPHVRLEYLYLSANYERLFGHEAESDRYLAMLGKAMDEAKNEELAGYVKYLRALAKETPKIVPGQSLEPVRPGERQYLMD